jgi:hypothetical protein
MTRSCTRRRWGQSASGSRGSTASLPASRRHSLMQLTRVWHNAASASSGLADAATRASAEQPARIAHRQSRRAWSPRRRPRRGELMPASHVSARSRSASSRDWSGSGADGVAARMHTLATAGQIRGSAELVPSSHGASGTSSRRRSSVSRSLTVSAAAASAGWTDSGLALQRSPASTEASSRTLLPWRGSACAPCPSSSIAIIWVSMCPLLCGTVTAGRGPAIQAQESRGGLGGRGRRMPIARRWSG